MKPLIKKIRRNLFPKWHAFSKLMKNKRSYLYSTGWIQSLEKNKPLDKDGNPIPWMNFPIVKFLENRLKDDYIMA